MFTSDTIILSKLTIIFGIGYYSIMNNNNNDVYQNKMSDQIKTKIAGIVLFLILTISNTNYKDVVAPDFNFRSVEKKTRTPPLYLRIYSVRINFKFLTTCSNF